MIDVENPAEWAQRDPQRSFIECAEWLQDQGHSIDDLGDAMMALSLTMANKVYGPRAVAARLLALAQKFANEAERTEQEDRDAISH